MKAKDTPRVMIGIGFDQDIVNGLQLPIQLASKLLIRGMRGTTDQNAVPSQWVEKGIFLLISYRSLPAATFQVNCLLT